MFNKQIFLKVYICTDWTQGEALIEIDVNRFTRIE